MNSGRSNENVTMNKTLFSLLLEALKPSQYRKYVKGWDHTKQAELFGGKYRIYLPLEKYVDDSDDKQEESSVKSKLFSTLSTHGYELVDYKKGLAKDKYRREVTVGRGLNKLQSKNPEIADLRKEFEQDPVRFGLKQKSTEKLVVISRHPYDIAGQSTGRGWTSCKNLKTGSMKKHVCPETKYDLIAYLINANDRNIENPLGRLMIHCYISEFNDQTIFVTEETIYPKELNIKPLGDAFESTVNAWLKTKFKLQHGMYVIEHDSYLDGTYDSYSAYQLAIKRNDVEFFDSWKPKKAVEYNAALIWAVKLNKVDIVKKLLSHTDTRLDNSAALLSAISRKNLDIIKLLVPISDINTNDGIPIRMAVKSGDIEILKLLLQYSNSKTNTNTAMNIAIENSEHEMIKLLIPFSDPKFNDSKILRYAVQYNQLEIVKLLIPVSDPKALDSSALRWAAENGQTDIVKLLIPVSDPKARDSHALRWAAKNGHVEVVKLLIPVSDPKADDSYALRWAAQNGHTEIVKLLIPVSDPKALDSSALRWAAENGHTEIVKLLIPVSDPKARDSYALRFAAENGHTEIVKLLIPVSDQNVVQELKLKALM